jgi:hypothetical protein
VDYSYQDNPSATTLSIITSSITTYGIMTLNITTFSIMTLSIITIKNATFSITKPSQTVMAFLLSVTYAKCCK